MTDIKVSEVFGGEVVGLSGQEVGASPYDWDCGILRRASGGHVAQFDEFDEAQAAAQAINQHDKLVEENQRLRKALKALVSLDEAGVWVSKTWKETFAEAKEVLNRT